jgi:hypothetical protein
MPSPGEYADLLRAIGRLLDQEALKALLLDPRVLAMAAKADDNPMDQALIVAHEDYFAVSWRAKTGAMQRRIYRQFDLDELLEQAKTLREEGTARSYGEREELLRTLGQELDRGGVELKGVMESADDDGLQLRGRVHGGDVFRIYPWETLRRLSESRKWLRRSV